MAKAPGRLQSWARSIKRDIHALYLASRDPRTPWHAKALAIAVAAYALSPIDLIPDFIPVLGYVDDAIILPFGIWLAVRMIPADVMNEHRAAVANRGRQRGPRSVAGAIAIVAVWIVSAGAACWLAYRWLA